MASDYVYVMQFDGDKIRSVGERTHDFSRLEVGGDEDEPVETCPGGLGAHRAGQIPRRGAGDRLETQFLSACQRHGDHAVFERERRVTDGVVFDVEFFHAQFAGQIVRFEERREAGMETHRRGALYREKFPVAPDTLGTFLYLFAGDHPLDPLIVIIHLKRPKTELADIDGFCLIRPLALPTF